MSRGLGDVYKRQVLLSSALRDSLIFLSNESTAAKTAMIENIPIVTPSKERNVLNLLLRSALKANEKLSLNKRRYTSIVTLKRLKIVAFQLL